MDHKREDANGSSFLYGLVYGPLIGKRSKNVSLGGTKKSSSHIRLYALETFARHVSVVRK
jgi:hypothetical protein